MIQVSSATRSENRELDHGTVALVSVSSSALAFAIDAEGAGMASTDVAERTRNRQGNVFCVWKEMLIGVEPSEQSRTIPNRQIHCDHRLSG